MDNLVRPNFDRGEHAASSMHATSALALHLARLRADRLINTDEIEERIGSVYSEAVKWLFEQPTGSR